MSIEIKKTDAKGRVVSLNNSQFKFIYVWCLPKLNKVQILTLGNAFHILVLISQQFSFDALKTRTFHYSYHKSCASIAAQLSYTFFSNVSSPLVSTHRSNLSYCVKRFLIFSDIRDSCPNHPRACACGVCSIMSDSLQPLSMGFSRQEYCKGCHFLLQGIFPTQGSDPCLSHRLHCRQILYH